MAKYEEEKMKKRILCLLLCMVMMVGVLASCGAKDDSEAVEDINEKASESAITLAMYLMSETEVSAEQEKAIEDAVNKITNADKIKLELFYYTPDKYYEALEKAFADRKAAEEQGLITKPNKDESVEDQTYEDDWGITRIEYPTIDSYQVDIFYMGGYAKFAEYLEMGMLQDWNTELKGASKLNDDYIFPQYLTYMRSLNSGVYALPTNKAIGEYTYMLINTELATKYHYNTVEGLKSFTNITDATTQDFLNLVAKNETGYAPIYSDLEQYELASTGVHYWGVDENGNLCNDFSLLASSYSTSAAYKSKDSYMYVGTAMDTPLVSQLKTIKQYEADGYFGTTDDLANGTAAIAYLKGGAEIPAMYADKYTAVVIDYPQITTEDIYSDMFAVTTYSSNSSRSMEIVTKLNTDEAFRNLILYGISKDEAPEGVEPNYEWVDSEYTDANGKPYQVIRRLNENYMMDINKTGNTLIAACLEGENPNNLREFVKAQNNDVKTSILMGFHLNYNNLKVNPEELQALRTVSATALEMLNNATVENFDEVVKSIRGLFTNEAKVVYNLSYNIEPAEGDEFCTFGYVYNLWATDLGIAPDEEE